MIVLLLLLLPAGTRQVSGIIEIEECEFINCLFFGVGFVGDLDVRAKMAEHTSDWEEGR